MGHGSTMASPVNVITRGYIYTKQTYPRHSLYRWHLHEIWLWFQPAPREAQAEDLHHAAAVSGEWMRSGMILWVRNAAVDRDERW